MATCRVSLPARLLLLILLSIISANAAEVHDLVYCSNQNTGATYQEVYNPFQTNGACRDTCRPGGFAIAIIQKYRCWCANEAPSDQEDLDTCNDECPGYGDHQCGNVAQGLFAYFLIDGKAPSGTAAPASSTTQSVSTIPRSSGSASSVRPTSVAGSSSLTVSATQQSSRTSSSPVASTTTGTTTSSSPSVIPLVTTVTGQVRTILITPTTPADANVGTSRSQSSGISTGSIVGIVLGVAIGIGAVIGFAVWFWFRRRHRMQAEEGSVAGSSARGGNHGVPSRQVSQMSSAGLLSKPPRIRTEGVISNAGPKSAESSQNDRRSLGTDQRLNPYAIYAHEESRLSNVSLQDNQDYSRQLRVANPDM